MHGAEALRPIGDRTLTAVVIQQPNFGSLEEVDALTDWAHANHLMVIAVVNPTSLALLKPPGLRGTEIDGRRGADIVWRRGAAPRRVPLASGGPYFGFMATRMQYYTRLSQKNFSIDTHFYPLGSCTMKYNPRACNKFAMLPNLLGRHPYAPDSPARATSPVCTNCRRCSRTSPA